MRATVKNNKGKLEKNAQVKEGDCIFPFKYKKVKYDDCMDSPKGKKCATEINEHGTMTKYGYCEEIGVAKPPSVRSSPKASPKKASPKASPKKASPKKASPKKASPKKGTVKKARKVAKLKLVQKATIKKRKALKKKSTSLKKLKPKISDKILGGIHQINIGMMRAGMVCHSGKTW